MNFSWKARDNLWEFLARGGTEIADLERSDWDRRWALMSKYRDLPMDMADAALVSIAETRKIRSVFTLDHEHFSVYKLSRIERLELIPKQLS